MPAYFCEQTGIRIDQPGVHESVDAKNGRPAVLEVEPGKIALVSDVVGASKKSSKPVAVKSDSDAAQNK